MSTNIEWTRGDDGAAGMTWNPLAGCSMVSPGCANCYAETMANRLAAMAKKDIADGRDPGKKRAYLNVMNEKGRWNGKVELIESALAEPLSWKKPRRVFVNSMTDLFQEGVPSDFVDRVFAVMALTPQHTFQILTKRPERMAEYSNHFARAGSIWQAAIEYGHSGALNTEPEIWPLPNVWLGTSVEDQARADERISHLRRCPAVVRFLSCEPLLGPIKFGPDGIHWVIVGGESGHGARPMHPDWARSIRDQCQAAGVAFFFKQWGEHVPWDRSNTTIVQASELVGRPDFKLHRRMMPDGSFPAGPCTREQMDDYQSRGVYMVRVGKKAAGRLLDGREWNEFPRPAEVSKC